MSLGLGVLAIDGWTEASEVLAMADRCHRPKHPEGDSDPRIAGFCERLRARFPDTGDAKGPWASTPLDVGIDHVFMQLRCGTSDPALKLIRELAIEYGLTIWDPQEGSAYRPTRVPSRDERFDADAAGWQRDRYREAVTGILHDQGPQQARALADRLIARGRLIPADVAPILHL